MRRDGDGDIRALGGLEQALDVLDGVVGRDTPADRAPGDAIGRQKVDLRIGDDESSAGKVQHHVAWRQERLGGGRIGVVLRLRAGGGKACGSSGKGRSAGQRGATGEFGVMIVIMAIAHGVLLR